MSKRVAVIDLGSNSVRLAIFERTSRLGFFILEEYKIKVRLGEGAYENNGFLQPHAMEAVSEAFREFKKFIKLHKARKVICTGTSALRDAPNAKEFIKNIFNEFGLSLKVIDGKTEAFLGGIAALNLLTPFHEATTLDIGGGSAELAKIKNGKIINTISLNIGTVRLKELFFDKNKINDANNYVKELVKHIPQEFMSDDLIVIGGSLRAVSLSIMQKISYPFESVHNFSYNLKEHYDFINAIQNSDIDNLSNFYIKQDRHDTIREGVMIFLEIANQIKAKQIHTSGVGIREGLFLSSILRPGITFPKNFSPSLKSLQDRFTKTQNTKILKHAKILFNLLSNLHEIQSEYLFILQVAVKLYNIGTSLGYCSKQNHAKYLVENGLEYGFSHKQRILIGLIIKNQDKKNVNLENYRSIIPDTNIVSWLSFILSLANYFSLNDEIEYELIDKSLKISKIGIYSKNAINSLTKPNNLEIEFV